jgi:hypothetical protein
MWIYTNVSLFLSSLQCTAVLLLPLLETLEFNNSKCRHSGESVISALAAESVGRYVCAFN